jgi:hypothetical protein
MFLQNILASCFSARPNKICEVMDLDISLEEVENADKKLS